MIIIIISVLRSVYKNMNKKLEVEWSAFSTRVNTHAVEF